MTAILFTLLFVLGGCAIVQFINSITSIVSTIVKHTPLGWEKRAICFGKIKILFGSHVCV